MTGPEVLVFDLYGTLVDPIAISTSLASHFGEDGLRIAELWRATQIDYAFRLTIMGRFEDFAWVTARSLEHALAACDRSLPQSDRDALLAAYDGLAAFPEVPAALRALHDAGREMVVLSNGSADMVAACLEQSGLAPFFRRWISVDAVRAYKPDPRVYAHAADVIGRPAGELRLVSSNPFDVVGAARAGMRTAWVNRTGRPFDTIAAAPELELRSLGDLP
jgi:2-haloacid dehalogenase